MKKETDPPRTARIPITFVQYPLQIAFDPELQPMDALVFWYISLLDKKDHCTASNETIAKKLRIKNPMSVSRSISRLVKLEYLLSEYKFNPRDKKRLRVLQINPNIANKHKYLVDEFNEK